MNTYKKLSDGSWGVQTDTKPAVGDVLTVTKKSGDITLVTVGEVWERNGKYICTIARRGGGNCENCDRYSGTLERRYDSSGLSGMVCPRCDRMRKEELSFG